MQMHFIDAPNEFYLGAAVNPDTGQVVEDAPVYYDARDLTTHGIILGMTGSGKTGLAVTLLEEAILDGIPAIIIDPSLSFGGSGGGEHSTATQAGHF